MMSLKLNPTTTLIALATAGLIAGCASQTPSDNESADNAASGQSDVVSQSNPLDSQAPADTMPATPASQYAEAPVTAPAQPLTQPVAPAAPMASTEPAPTAPAADAYPSSTLSNSDAASGTTETPLPPRADRN
jgi:hypothetical protein